MIIQITQANINMGIRNSQVECPVARGLFESTGKEWRVWNQGTCLAEDSKRLWIMFPEWVTEMIDAYDDNWKMDPFEFEIDYIV